MSICRHDRPISSSAARRTTGFSGSIGVPPRTAEERSATHRLCPGTHLVARRRTVPYTRHVTGERHDPRGAVLALPLDERAELAAELLASLDGEPDEDVDAAWAAEIERRIRKVRADGTAGRDWSEIVGELRGDR